MMSIVWPFLAKKSLFLCILELAISFLSFVSEINSFINVIFIVCHNSTVICKVTTDLQQKVKEDVVTFSKEERKQR